MKKIDIIIADDHALFRSGMEELLKKQEDLNIIATVGDGEQLLQTLKNIKPDIVLLDLTMPKVNGFEALSIISKTYPNIKTIILSMHDDGGYIAKCAKAGAYSYLLKNTDEEELLKTIRTVSSGRRYYSFEISEKMVNNLTEEEHSFKNPTKKESEILKMLSEGLTTKEISEKLFISTRTVETHRANLLKKLEVKNSVELISRAKALGLL